MQGRPLLPVGLLVIVGCAAGPAPTVVMPTTLDRPFVAGYHAYWTEDAWVDYPWDVLDELYFFELELGADGEIMDAHGWPHRWGPMVTAASEAGVQVVPTISMHDPEAFEALFADAARVGVAVDRVTGLLDASTEREGLELAGIHLDVEVFQPVSPDARDGYTAFVARLAEAMRRHHPGRSLSVFVLAFDDDDVYNERALGQIADFVVVQGYDYHSMGSANAGPVAALRGWGRLNWETVLQRFDGFGVPRDRIVMSVPLYGYEWPVVSEEPGAATRGEGVTVPYDAPDDVFPELPRAREQAERHGIRRDALSGAPFYVYSVDGGWIQGWAEDVESLASKAAFARDNGLGGVALFPLAYGGVEIWNELRRAFPRSR
ncbi:MAG: hypothetical protein HKN72_02910 [Gemmatimonadetes bacterium]|nr:hypothetical protein [Gemmatimonadota bacterium]NNL30832.1 hypothetical protein [Gemmatimonadota bacterium]